MTLAYVFWHWPAPGLDRGAYEDRLRAFQRSLVASGAAQAHDVGSFSLARAPWDGAAPGPYEDWYLVEDWPALGALNDRANAGPNRVPHDDIARQTAGGAGGVYRLVAGVRAPPAGVRHALWTAKPRDVPYETARAQLEGIGDAMVLQRQMVLGPAPEFAILSVRPVGAPWAATATSPRAL